MIRLALVELGLDLAFDSVRRGQFVTRLRVGLGFEIVLGTDDEVSDALPGTSKKRTNMTSERKRGSVGQVFDSDSEVEASGTPKVARDSKGKFCKKPVRPGTPWSSVPDDVDGVTEGDFAASEGTDSTLTEVGSVGRKVVAGKKKQGPVKKLSSTEIEVLPATNLKEYAGHQLDSILDVASNSGNLSGPYIKRLKVAAKALREVVEALAERTETDETQKLKRENKSLRQQNEGLKDEVKAWKLEAEEKRAEVRKAWQDREAPPQHDWQEVMKETVTAAVVSMGNSLQNVFGGMINARLDGIEDRLLPKKIVRPPLAGDKKRLAVAAERSERVQAGPAADRTGKTMTANPSAAIDMAGNATDAPLGMEWAQLPAADPSRNPVSSELESWSVVARRKRSTKGPVTVSKPTPMATAKPKPKLPAPPRSAAVIITLQPVAVERGEDYRSVLAKVQERVLLTECGITDLSLRSTVTGSKIIEIPGSLGAEQADSLASKMQEAVGDLAVVARPTKKAEIRIVEIDDSVSKQEVMEAAAVKGGCDPAQIRAGEIRAYGRGMGTMFMSLPVAAARILAEDGRLRVGWSVARVHAIETKPLRCFKCMGVGHTRPLCPSTADRRTLCFKCGEAGHMAANCVARKLRCDVCTEAGRPADHVMGGANCNPPLTKGGASTPVLALRDGGHIQVAGGSGSMPDVADMDQQ